MPQKAVKKPPVRHCVGCGEGKPKKELVRVVRNNAGDITLDLTGKKPGRGAYVCKNTACLAKAQKRGGLQRAFSAPVPNEVYQQLEDELVGVPDDTEN